jgi:hypothetical protein
VTRVETKGFSGRVRSQTFSEESSSTPGGLNPRIWTPPGNQARAVSNLLLLRKHKLSIVGVLAGSERVDGGECGSQNVKIDFEISTVASEEH